MDCGRPAAGNAVVIVPVYNHGASVAAVIQKVLLLKFPVMVVDDGSTDDTYENIRSIPGIQVLRHDVNMGKGAALVTGMKATAREIRWAVTIDADGQHDPADISSLLATANENPGAVVIGNRTGMDAAPWTSRFGRKFSNFWLRMSGVPPVTDSQSGFRVYPLPEVLHLGVKARRYQYELEVLAKAAWRGIGIVETPVSVTYLPPGQRISHFRPWRDFFRNAHTFSRLITRRVFSPCLWRRPAPGARRS
jgi:glycosyltransferase involved in cell wall biosynthesis